MTTKSMFKTKKICKVESSTYGECLWFMWHPPLSCSEVWWEYDSHMVMVCALYSQTNVMGSLTTKLTHYVSIEVSIGELVLLHWSEFWIYMVSWHTVCGAYLHWGWYHGDYHHVKWIVVMNWGWCFLFTNLL